MMKNILFTVLGLLFFNSCKNEPATTSTFATISGTIDNNESDEIIIANQYYSKTIAIDETGKFTDTLKVVDGFFTFKNGEQNTVIELKNGYDVQIEYNSDSLVETLAFSGLGALTNNYFADKMRVQERDGFLDFNAYFILEKPEFNAKVAKVKSTLDDLISNAEGLDSIIIANEERNNQLLLRYLSSSYAEKHQVLTELGKGKASPMFTYADINGKKVSLHSLKGKYVYIDVWATWCGPCKVQIPYLKQIEKTYEGRNIAFIGLSIDTQENKGNWEKMVKERDLKGVQVLADKDWHSEFIQGYFITSIPRFILIDPDGNIISADAPRPSEPALIKLFNDLNI